MSNAQVTTNMQSNTQLQSFCTISATDIGFGQINPMTYIGYSTGSGGITVLCSNKVNYSIGPTGGYDASIIHILKGTGNNKDGLRVLLEKSNLTQNNNSNYASNSPIVGGDGKDQFYRIRAHLSKDYTVSAKDATFTNQFNYQAKPDIYSTTITSIITY